jgi:hypothetical protein
MSDSFEEQLSQLSKLALLCRTLGHAWEPDPDKYVVSNMYTLYLTCSRCEAEKDLVAIDGFRQSQRMRYDFDKFPIFKGIGGRLSVEQRAAITDALAAEFPSTETPRR